jgi:hypothetical protein
VHEGNYDNGRLWHLLKEIIIIKEIKQILRINYSYGWNFLNYLYTLKNVPKLYEWGNFKEKFKTLP